VWSINYRELTEEDMMLLDEFFSVEAGHYQAFVFEVESWKENNYE
jgi:hypothetical protein